MLLKRALHSIKRALYSIKRAWHVQYFVQSDTQRCLCMRCSPTNQYLIKESVTQKSPIFNQKRPIFNQKSPIFYIKRARHQRCMRIRCDWKEQYLITENVTQKSHILYQKSQIFHAKWYEMVYVHQMWLERALSNQGRCYSKEPYTLWKEPNISFRVIRNLQEQYLITENVNQQSLIFYQRSLMFHPKWYEMVYVHQMWLARAMSNQGRRYSKEPYTLSKQPNIWFKVIRNGVRASDVTWKSNISSRQMLLERAHFLSKEPHILWKSPIF